ncbi:MAG: TolB family protein [Candidatus Sericytochromatia bacterium]
MMRKPLVLTALMATTLGGLATSCGPGAGINFGCNTFYTLQANSQTIGINDRVPIQLLVNNPCNHNLEYRFIANRGQVLSQNPLLPIAEYAAPFTGGEDIITVSVYDRTDNVNLPQQQRPLLVLGDGLAFVEAPAAGTSLGDYDNGVIKVTGIQGVGSGTAPRQVAIGRQPVISPDGRSIAYTYYPGDGTSQIRMQDAIGNVTILTGNGGSFNRDPAWAPIGNDMNLHLVFSSDRLSTSTGQSADQRGEAFNIWRVSALGQNLQQLASTPGNNRTPAWSPDGRTVIYSSSFSQNRVQNFSNLWQLDLSTGRLLQLTYETVPDKGAYEPRFSPDGTKVVYSRKYISRQPSQLFNFQKIWLVDLNTIDIPSLLPYLPTQPGGGTGAGPVPGPGMTNPNLPQTVGNANGNFGNIATQEYDEGTTESSPSFSVDGRWITYVRKQGEDLRTVSIPSNPGNLGTVGFEPINVLPQGAERALEVSWARQSRSFSRY